MGFELVEVYKEVRAFRQRTDRVGYLARVPAGAVVPERPVQVPAVVGSGPPTGSQCERVGAKDDPAGAGRGIRRRIDENLACNRQRVSFVAMKRAAQDYERPVAVADLDDGVPDAEPWPYCRLEVVQ